MKPTLKSAFMRGWNFNWNKKEPVVQAPMIWTKYGNMMEESLSLQVTWEQGPDYIKCIRTHRDVHGEIVKQGADILSFKGLTGESVIGTVS